MGIGRSLCLGRAGLDGGCMAMIEIEYLTDKNGQPKAVVIPIELWRQLFPKDDVSVEELSALIPISKFGEKSREIDCRGCRELALARLS